MLTATAEAGAWQVLGQRPLNLPTLAPGEPCPQTRGRQVTRFYAAALGNGPVYPVGLGTDGVLHYGESGETGEWAYVKVLWIKSSKYTGPALIRGHQIDGPNELRFEAGSDPPSELQFPPEGTAVSPGVAWGWKERPSYTRVRASGCYAYQVDGLDFSLVIVFQAVP